MWCCLLACLTCALWLGAGLARRPSVALSAGPTRPALPPARCPAAFIELEGVCVPAPSRPGEAPTLSPSQAARAGKLLGLGSAVASSALDQAAVPELWRLSGEALTTRPAPAQPVPCPRLNVLRLWVRTVDANGGWVLLHAERAAPGPALAVLVVGVDPTATSAKPGQACSADAALGLARDRVTLAVRQLERPAAESAAAQTWYSSGTPLGLDALLQLASD